MFRFSIKRKESGETRMIPTKTFDEIRKAHYARIPKKADINEWKKFDEIMKKERWVSVDVLRQKLRQLEQNNNNDFVNFDLVGFLEWHGVKYDNWLKLQLFDLISSLQQKVKVRIDELLVGLEPEEAKKS